MKKGGCKQCGAKWGVGMLELWSHQSSPAAAPFFSGNWFSRHFPRERVSKKHFCLISLSKYRELFSLTDFEVEQEGDTEC